MDKGKRINIVSYIVIFIYFIFHLTMLFYHEAWRDEAQAWCLTKALPLQGILNELPAEGHPILWFLFLYPFSHGGLCFKYVGLLSLLLMTVAVYFFLVKISMDYRIKYVVLFSSIFMFYNPVISRVYALCLLIIVLLIYEWPKRHTEPVRYNFLVALLFQTHIIFAGLAGGLLLTSCIEIFSKKTKNKNEKKAILIPLFSAICLILELWQKNGKKTFIKVGTSLFIDRLKLGNQRDTFKLFAMKLFGLEGVIWSEKYAMVSLLVFVLCMILMISMLIIYCISNRKVPLEMIPVSCGMVFYWFLVICVRGTDHEQLAICCLLIILMGVSLLYDKINSLVLVFSVICILSYLPVVCIVKWDVMSSYSNGRKMADYVLDNVLPEENIVVLDSNRAVSVAAYLLDFRGNILSYSTGDKYTYFSWGENYKDVDIFIDEFRINPYKEAEYFLSSTIIEEPTLCLVHKEDGINKWGENYYLYLYRDSSIEAD